MQQGSIALEADKTYRLSFDASASAPKSIQAVVSQGNGGEAKYMDEKVDLNEIKQPYTLTFTMGETADAAALLNFGLGRPLAEEHSVSIQNVMLFEVNPGADLGDSRYTSI